MLTSFSKGLLAGVFACAVPGFASVITGSAGCALEPISGGTTVTSSAPLTSATTVNANCAFPGSLTPNAQASAQATLGVGSLIVQATASLNGASGIVSNSGANVTMTTDVTSGATGPGFLKILNAQAFGTSSGFGSSGSGVVRVFGPGVNLVYLSGGGSPLPCNLADPSNLFTCPIADVGGIYTISLEGQARAASAPSANALGGGLVTFQFLRADGSVIDPVPEPRTLLLLASSLLAGGCLQRLRGRP